jgi:hypothetical protein
MYSSSREREGWKVARTPTDEDGSAMFICQSLTRQPGLLGGPFLAKLEQQHIPLPSQKCTSE